MSEERVIGVNSLDNLAVAIEDVGEPYGIRVRATTPHGQFYRSGRKFTKDGVVLTEKDFAELGEDGLAAILTEPNLVCELFPLDEEDEEDEDGPGEPIEPDHTTERPAAQPETRGDDRAARILEAVRAIQESGETDEFTAGGAPKIEAIAERSGVATPTAAERDAALAKLDAEAGEGSRS